MYTNNLAHDDYVPYTASDIAKVFDDEYFIPVTTSMANYAGTMIPVKLIQCLKKKGLLPSELVSHYSHNMIQFKSLDDGIKWLEKLNKYLLEKWRLVKIARDY